MAALGAGLASLIAFHKCNHKAKYIMRLINRYRTLSIGFACWLYVQLIRHSYQFGQRFGFHLEHHTSSVNFDGLFSSAKISASLFVE
jgi:hypothetical protein